MAERWKWIRVFASAFHLPEISFKSHVSSVKKITPFGFSTYFLQQPIKKYLKRGINFKTFLRIHARGCTAGYQLCSLKAARSILVSFLVPWDRRTEQIIVFVMPEKYNLEISASNILLEHFCDFLQFSQTKSGLFLVFRPLPPSLTFLSVHN